MSLSVSICAHVFSLLYFACCVNVSLLLSLPFSLFPHQNSKGYTPAAFEDVVEEVAPAVVAVVAATPPEETFDVG